MSLVDLPIVITLAGQGILMGALPLPLIFGLFAATLLFALLFALLLDTAKVALFRHLRIE